MTTFRRVFPALPVLRDGQFVTGPSEALSQLIQRRLADLGDEDGPMSLRRAVGRSRGGFSHETVRRLMLGLHSGGISDKVAQGLALALDVPLTEVYQAAQVRRPDGRWKWPARFDRLDPAQRRVVESVAAALLDASERDPRQSR